MSTKLVRIIPVLESADIDRDVAWYKEKTGFDVSFLHEKMYAGLYRDDFEIHLQWHAGTKDDPMNGGAVIRVDVKKYQTDLRRVEGKRNRKGYRFQS